MRLSLRLSALSHIYYQNYITLQDKLVLRRLLSWLSLQKALRCLGILSVTQSIPRNVRKRQFYPLAHVRMGNMARVRIQKQMTQQPK